MISTHSLSKTAFPGTAYRSFRPQQGGETRARQDLLQGFAVLSSAAGAEKSGICSVPWMGETPGNA